MTSQPSSFLREVLPNPLYLQPSSCKTEQVVEPLILFLSAVYLETIKVHCEQDYQ